MGIEVVHYYLRGGGEEGKGEGEREGMERDV